MVGIIELADRVGPVTVTGNVAGEINESEPVVCIEKAMGSCGDEPECVKRFLEIQCEIPMETRGGIGGITGS